MKHARIPSLLLGALLLSGCTPTIDAASLDTAAEQLQRWLDEDGRTVYGIAAGSIDTQSLQIELPHNRDGLTLVTACTGGEGTVELTINEQEPLSIQCSTNGTVEHAAHAYTVQGNRLLITVDSATAGAAWALAATAGS